MSDLSSIYARRFQAGQSQNKRLILWKVLARRWFPKWIRPEDSVLELGAGYCLFINEITASRKIAVDANPDTLTFAGPEVQVLITSAAALDDLHSNSIDVVFSSNFFEHLDNRSQLFDVLQEAHRALRPGGLILTLMPNIDYVKWKFWDFVDHALPLNTKSLTEALELADFEVVYALSRFLPYTAEGRVLPIPNWAWRLLSVLYLKLPIAWRFIGKQMFVVARKD